MIIGIESSCDESAIAVFDKNQGIIFNEISSQIATHAEYGGVVPEIAAREHLKNFPVLLQHLLQSVDLSAVEAVAVTHGPGLAGCLSLGISVAKTLALNLNKPIIPVNHLRGHALSPFLSKLYPNNIKNHALNLSDLLPHLGLLVSGGNTILFIIDKDLKITILGKTVDDAAGEAFDKGAKLLGMPYPGGHLIEKYALSGDKQFYQFPQAFRETNELKFSFSGLKTSLRYFLESINDQQFEENFNNICASYQEAIISALSRKVQQALKSYPEINSLGLSGGVSNNKYLRAKISELANMHNIDYLIPEPKYTGDNAAMIAFSAYQTIQFNGYIADTITVNPNLALY